MIKKTVLLLQLLCSFNLIFAQKIDNMASFRALNVDRYFRINYENDFFAEQDRNYTQGYNFEFVLPALIKNPVNYLFLLPKSSEVSYGLSLESFGYTPRNYKSADIQYGDRPFAAVIVLKSFLIAIHPETSSRVMSSLSTGVIGPAALGDETQTGIHRAIDNDLPKGWQHQIQNDLVINYELSYEKQLYRHRDLLSLTTVSHARLGTLFTNASTGFTMTLGKINHPFSGGQSDRKFQLYWYAQPILSIIGFDSSMQGGILNNNSPYTISASNIKRFVFQQNYGIVIRIRQLYVEYVRSWITKEFESGESAMWGGVRVGFGF